MVMKDYRAIVVGTDGSELAEPTVSRAAWLSAHGDADLIVVCAWSGLSRRDDAKNVMTTGGDTRVGVVIGRTAANAALTSAVETAAKAGATIRAALLVQGEPAEALLEAAQTHTAELIVMGATRRVSLADRLIGTVANDVVRRADCDVLLVRPERDAEEFERPESGG
ncbi:MAG: universal stress protein [Gordonia sp. (in: high G+C Gram-positive bacteria)]